MDRYLHLQMDGPWRLLNIEFSDETTMMSCAHFLPPTAHGAPPLSCQDPGSDPSTMAAATVAAADNSNQTQLEELENMSFEEGFLLDDPEMMSFLSKDDESTGGLCRKNPWTSTTSSVKGGGGKRMKMEVGKRIGFRTKSEVDVLDDGYKWRKYGKKSVKNSPNPRNYYKCSSEGCSVKKRVERDRSDSSYVITCYEGMHHHITPGMMYCYANPHGISSTPWFSSSAHLPQLINPYPGNTYAISSYGYHVP